MKRGIFVTGTDTGVGKTIASAALLLALRDGGVDAGYMKPVATGCTVEGERLISPDLKFIRRICPVDDDGLVNPVAFAPPVDPLSASAMEGKGIDLHVILEAFKELSGRHDLLVVEGIGGIAVPIKRDFDVCDLISELGLPAVVVMRSSLGTINHTFLTVDYARRKGVNVIGLIVNFTESSRGDVADRTGPELVRRILDIPIIGRMDYDPDLASDARRAIHRFSLELAEWAIGRFIKGSIK